MADVVADVGHVAVAFVDWAFVTAEKITYPDAKVLFDKKLAPDQAITVMKDGLAIIEGMKEFTVPNLENAFRSKAEEMGIKIGPFLTAFRVAITGKTIAPPLFESMMVLGQRETVTRLQNALRGDGNNVVRGAYWSLKLKSR